MDPSPICGEAGLQTTAPADLAARAEADGIIPLAEFCVNVQMLNFTPFCHTNENPQSIISLDQVEVDLSRLIVRGEAGFFVYIMKDGLSKGYLTLQIAGKYPSQALHLLNNNLHQEGFDRRHILPGAHIAQF